jgi:hypothetical protein
MVGGKKKKLVVEAIRLSVIGRDKKCNWKNLNVYCALVRSFSLSLFLNNLFAYWLEAAKKGKKVNDSLPCLFLSLFSLPIISLETLFRSQIVFFNIDQICSLFCSFHHQLSLSLFFYVPLFLYKCVRFSFLFCTHQD